MMWGVYPMREPPKTKRALENELESLKQRIREFELAESEHQRAPEALRKSREFFKAIIQNASDIILIVDKLGTITYASPSVERFLGYGPDELIGKSSLDLIASEDKSRAMQDFAGALQTKEVTLPNVFRVRHKNGAERIVEGFGKNLLDSPVVAGFVMNIRDITDRKRVEEALSKSEEQFRTIFDRASDGILIADAVTRKFLKGNAAICSMLGYTKEEIENLTPYDIHPPNDIGHVLDEFERQAKGEKVLAESLPVLRKDRTIFYADINSAPTTIGGIKYLVGIFRDMTEQKRARDEIAILAETGRMISSTLEIDEVYRRIAAEIGKLIFFDSLTINLFNSRQETLEVAYVSGLNLPGRRVGDSFPARGTVWEEAVRTLRGLIIQSENPEDLVDKFPRLAVSVQAGLRSVMSVPLISNGEVIGILVIRSKKPIAYTKQDLRLAEKIGIEIAGAIANAKLFTDLKKTETSLRESEGRFRSLFEQAAVGVAEIEIGTSRFVTVNRRLCEMVGRTEEEMLATTFHAITHPEDIPLDEGKRALLLAGKIRQYSREKRYLRKDGAIVWVNITISSFWKPGETPERNMIVVEDITERKKAEKQLQSTLESLRAAVNTTIQVMVSAVETRDPYTSGHQLRSADLARAIATEMRLPQEKIDAIRMAGSIHDIGKLSIPVEILSKPTKLSEIEFSLIKEHARRGFEMLKNVESPWPLAEIVYQHHERMDGSGYPRRLKGEDICIEARILTVADVVEAMASHRPYRPGLGIDAALNEVEKNRGLFYDNTVADACLRLFREKGFQLSAT